jgi:hypothetical protein
MRHLKDRLVVVVFIVEGAKLVTLTKEPYDVVSHFNITLLCMSDLEL